METITINCANKNCNKRFKRAKHISNKHYLPDNVRSFNCVTCSPKCSKEYNYNNSHKETKMKDGVIYSNEKSN